MLHVIEADRINLLTGAFNVWFRVPVHSSRVQEFKVRRSPVRSVSILQSAERRTLNSERGT
jgi:hypothetical protein